MNSQENPNSVTAPDGRLSDELRNMIEGMSVSVDVSTSDHDAGHRYFGTVTEVMDDHTDKHGVTLLVQDAEPNFAPTPPAQAADSVLEDAARLLESQHTWLTNVAAANLVRSLAARKQGASHD